MNDRSAVAGSEDVETEARESAKAFVAVARERALAKAAYLKQTAAVPPLGVKKPRGPQQQLHGPAFGFGTAPAHTPAPLQLDPVLDRGALGGLASDLSFVSSAEPDAGAEGSVTHNQTDENAGDTSTSSAPARAGDLALASLALAAEALPPELVVQSNAANAAAGRRALGRAPHLYGAAPGAASAHTPSSAAAYAARLAARRRLVAVLGPALGATPATAGTAHIPTPLLASRAAAAASAAGRGPGAYDAAAAIDYVTSKGTGGAVTFASAPRSAQPSLKPLRHSPQPGADVPPMVTNTPRRMEEAAGASDSKEGGIDVSGLLWDDAEGHITRIPGGPLSSVNVVATSQPPTEQKSPQRVFPQAHPAIPQPQLQQPTPVQYLQRDELLPAAAAVHALGRMRAVISSASRVLRALEMEELEAAAMAARERAEAEAEAEAHRVAASVTASPPEAATQPSSRQSSPSASASVSPTPAASPQPSASPHSGPSVVVQPQVATSSRGRTRVPRSSWAAQAAAEAGAAAVRLARRKAEEERQRNAEAGVNAAAADEAERRRRSVTPSASPPQPQMRLRSTSRSPSPADPSAPVAVALRRTASASGRSDSEAAAGETASPAPAEPSMAKALPPLQRRAVSLPAPARRPLATVAEAAADAAVAAPTSESLAVPPQPLLRVVKAKAKAQARRTSGTAASTQQADASKSADEVAPARLSRRAVSAERKLPQTAAIADPASDTTATQLAETVPSAQEESWTAFADLPYSEAVEGRALHGGRLAPINAGAPSVDGLPPQHGHKPSRDPDRDRRGREHGKGKRRSKSTSDASRPRAADRELDLAAAATGLQHLDTSELEAELIGLELPHAGAEKSSRPSAAAAEGDVLVLRPLMRPNAKRQATVVFATAERTPQPWQPHDSELPPPTEGRGSGTDDDLLSLPPGHGGSDNANGPKGVVTFAQLTAARDFGSVSDAPAWSDPELPLPDDGAPTSGADRSGGFHVTPAGMSLRSRGSGIPAFSKQSGRPGALEPIARKPQPASSLFTVTEDEHAEL